MIMMRWMIGQLLLSVALAISAIRFGSDSSSNDIALFFDASVSKYLLLFQTTFQYMKSPFTVCFRHRPAISLGETCRLGNQTGSFDCIARDPATLKYMTWVLSSDYLVKSNVQNYIPNSAHALAYTYSLGLSLDGVVGAANTNFSLLGQADSIFQVIFGNSYDLSGQGVTIKQGYVSTFYDKWQKNSDNLMMPSQFICVVYQDIVNLVFLGVRYRDGSDVYMAAFVNYHLNKLNFNMWEGLSFSKNKVNRDMVGLIPALGEVQDLFSLYKTAPFLDTSENINGTNDWTLLASSSDINNMQPFWFYYTQAYRRCITEDDAGDEEITFRIGNQHCYAAHFQEQPDQNFISATDKDLIHQVLQCFEPILALHAMLAVPCMILILFLF